MGELSWYIGIMDRNEKKALIKVTIQFPGEILEWSAANYFNPDEMDLNEVFEGMCLAFERAFEKEKNEVLGHGKISDTG